MQNIRLERKKMRQIRMEQMQVDERINAVTAADGVVPSAVPCKIDLVGDLMAGADIYPLEAVASQFAN
jgi:hypothetical protein